MSTKKLQILGSLGNTIPDALPNPNKLIVEGAISAEYDGSQEVTVNIPEPKVLHVEVAISETGAATSLVGATTTQVFDAVANGVEVCLYATISDTETRYYHAHKQESGLSGDNIRFVYSNATEIDTITISRNGLNTLIGRGVQTLSAETIGAANASDLTAHVNNSDIHVTADQKLLWDAKADVDQIPTSLKNPYKLTFAGAVTGEYDGSTPLDVEIPVATDGYTPVKGVDYWTQEEQDAIADEANTIIAEELAKRGQLKPEFANSIEECTDTTKLYVLPDGYIYAYVLTETEVDGGPAYTNRLPLATDTDRVSIYGGDYNGDGVNDGYLTGQRLSSSGSLSSQADMCVSGFIPAAVGDIVRIKGTLPRSAGNTGSYLITYNSSNTKVGYKMFGQTGDNSDWKAPSAGYHTYENGVLIIPLTEANFGSGFDAFRFSAGTIDANSIVTVNEEIVEGGTIITTEYQWVSTGHAFVPADYEDRIIALEEATEELASGLGEAKSTDGLMYIAPDGDDSNSGLSASAPKKTVAACVAAGAKRISAKRGVYVEQVSLSNIDSLEIFPTDNDQEYSTDADWPPIVFDLSDTLAVSNLESYNAIKRIAYSNSANEQLNKVFTAQSQPTIISDGYGSRYNATVWLMSSDEKTVCLKLKPVLTVAECEAEANTFSYVDGYIYVNADMTGVEKIVVPTNWDSGFRITDADKVVLREVEVRFSGSYNVWILNCPHFEMYKCSSKYTSYGSGFDIDNANGVFTSCYATKNFDGFGISGYGHTTFVDCVSEFNFDDGVSHHNGTEGTFIGGRYEGNGKGGNTPAYGAKVNIYGGIYKDNASFGIGYLYTSTHNPASGSIDGAVIVDNKVGLKIDTNCTVTATSCSFENNGTDKVVNGYLTEYANTSGSSTSGTDDTTSNTNYNLLATATDTDRVTIYGGDYNGDGKNDGYITGYRLSSSGSTTAHSSFCSSGFIPAQKDDVLRIKGVLPYNGDTSAYVIAYDSSNAVTGSITIGVNGDRSDWTTPTDGRHTYENGVLIIPLTESNFGTGFNAIRFSAGTIDENTVVTINEKTTNGEDVDYLAVIRNWDTPIYDRVPVFLMDSEKPAVTSDEKTVNAVYAKYDTLVDANPRYITRTDMGMCSDGVTPVYRYDFREPEPHHQSGMQWSETKPTVIIVSGIHNEWGGIYSLYYAMEEIVNNPELDDLRRNVHFVIVPVMNPYCIVGAYSDTYHVKNANGVEIHRNFEVGFKYPTDSGYIAEGEIHHGGTEPLSEVETQYINNIFKEYPDAALFMTCHSAQRDTRWGTGFIWPSTATEYTCNLGYRLVDKMSKAWHKKYGTTWEEGCVRENEYVLADTDTYPYATALEDGDYRAGHAHVSSTNGTETRQATKYGIQGANVEVLDTFWVLDSTNLGSKVTTHGAETYINYLLMYMGCYDHKDKKLYYVG